MPALCFAVPRAARRSAMLVAALGLVWGGVARAQVPLVVDGQPAVTKADGPCFDNSSRFVNCVNGTVTDTFTGLVWMQQAGCLEFPGTGGTNSDDWATAMAAAAALADGLCGLTDGSEPGDWRLPTREEWEDTVAHARDTLNCGAGGATWPNDTGKACSTTGVSSFTGIAEVVYWSSTVDATNPARVEATDLDTGNAILKVFKFANASIWAVRDGQ